LDLVNVLGIVLTLISVSCTFAPVGAVLITYQNDPAGMVVTPEVNQMLNSNLFNGSFALPQLVSYDYNEASHTCTYVINFTNPVNLNLTLNEASAQIVCAGDNFSLANASLVNPVTFFASETANLTMTCVLSPDISDHLATCHDSAKSLDIELSALTINVEDITVQLSQPFRISNVPVQ
jgi:hypothetical protein